MSLIHSQLYQNERFDRIDMDGHIRELSHHLQSVYGSGKKIDLILTPSKVYLSVSQAIPCALVLNELISNVFKHAFREKNREWEVLVRRLKPHPHSRVEPAKDYP